MLRSSFSSASFSKLPNVLAKIINREIKAFESAGCKYIQVSDELVGRGRKPEGWRGG